MEHYNSTLNRTPATGRRTIVKGAAWTVPALAVGAPAAHAGVSGCEVTGSLQIAPNSILPLDAVCVQNSQSGNIGVPRIRSNYGRVWLPRKITICSCDDISGWYRFRETDNLSNFQIEVDGRHNDQNSSTSGYRPPFYLDSFGAAGGCKDFLLTYRTSATRPYSTANSAPGAGDQVTINFVLQRSTQNQGDPNTPPTGTGGWVQEATFNVTGRVWRTIRENCWYGSGNCDPISFNSCSTQNGGGTAGASSESRSGDSSSSETREGGVMPEGETTEDKSAPQQAPPSDPTAD